MLPIVGRPARVALWLAVLASGRAEPNPVIGRSAADYVPDLEPLFAPQSSEMRELVGRFTADRAELERFFNVPGSAERSRRLRVFYATWQSRLQAGDYDRLGVEGRIDATLLGTRLAYELRLLDREDARAREIAALLPFASDVARLQESRRFLDPVDPKAAAVTLDSMRRAVERARAAVEAGLKPGKERADDAPPRTQDGTSRPTPGAIAAKDVPAPLMPTKIVAWRAVNRLAELRGALGEWFQTFDGYDPLFGWWAREPYKQLATALEDYGKLLREKVVGVDPKSKDEPIIGDPVGREGLLAELANEMIVYTPEQLIAIAEREFAWVDRELKRAAREMGCGDDWKAALERVKQDHVEPGQQPTLVRDLALEAIQYVRERDLVTVPPLAADVWLLRMMSPERQKTAPFFLGGDDILVAFPTDAMTQEEKLQSLRANNRHFARATVFHELVPGHHLQFYANKRFNPHRQLFTTPFWIEGWSVWWEFHLWDLNFITTPEDRIGALFWRAHRCARIIFSLKFHLGEWTPQQCIDFLVERVGHERASAAGEVRRSFNGQWSPLYQAGYMLGAMQFRALYQQFVASGKMKEREFHDAILQGGPMPIELVRARLAKEKLRRNFEPQWRFAD